MREVDLSLVSCYTMPSGIGDLANNQVCVVAQAAILDALSKGQTITDITDSLDCACPVLRILAIALNDGNWWKSIAERTANLTPLISLLLDSRRDPIVTAKRAMEASVFAESCAESCAEYAAKSAAKCAEYDAKYAKSCAKYAKYAAKYAECAAKSCAESAAEYAESAAESAAKCAEYDAKSAANSAAESAEYAANSAAKCAEYDAKYAAVRNEFMAAWMRIEQIQA